jgi:hypothetical protein
MQAFVRCKSLKDITCESPSQLTQIEAGAFGYCESLKSIYIPASVRSLADKYLKECSSLECFTVVLPLYLTRIGRKTFASCQSLESICIPSSVEVIASECFRGCISLEGVIFASPSQLADIDVFAFAECKSPKPIRIPASLPAFAGLSFEDCSALSLLTFETPSKIQSFLGILPHSRSWINVPNSVKGLVCDVLVQENQSLVLNFAPESQLEYFYLSAASPPAHAFARFSEEILKMYRSHPELGDLCDSPFCCRR